MFVLFIMNIIYKFEFLMLGEENYILLVDKYFVIYVFLKV